MVVGGNQHPPTPITWTEKQIWGPHPPKNANSPWASKLSHSSCGKSGSLTPQLREKPDICGALTIWAARRLWEKGRLPKSVLSGRQNTGMLLSERYKCPFGLMSIPIPPAGREARPRESRGTRHQLPPLSKWPPQKDTVAKRDLPLMRGKVKINSLEYP